MKILIVEDDKDLCDILKKSLVAQSCTVEVASDGGNGSFLGKNYDYDVIILDYSLPKKDGLTVCKDIRAAGKSTPILFLSMTDATETKVAAFESGADDYMVKPFSIQELQARLRALTRRPTTILKPLVSVGDLVLDINTRVVTLAGATINLTRKEFSVLEYLMRHRGTIVSRILIMEHVWTADSDLFSNAVEAHIRNIRKKIHRPHTPELIVNIPGRGYMMPVLESHQ